MADETVRIKLEVDNKEGKKEIKEFEFSLDSLEKAYKEIGRSAKKASADSEQLFEVMQKLDGGLVRVKLSAKDVTAALSQIRASNLKALKESAERIENLGSKMADLGGRITGAFTLPIVGAFAAAISQSKALQDELKPLQEAFAGVAAELGNALVPLVKEMTPMILEFAKSMTDLIKKFNDLPTGTKGAIIGLVGFFAAIGPVVFGLGQIIQTVGVAQGVIAGLGFTLPTLGSGLTAAGIGMRAFGASIYAALGPVGALILAITTLINLVNSEFGQRGITAAKQLLVMASGGLGDLVGGKDYGNRVRQNGAQSLGLTGRANGGPVMPGRSYMVGERGPEMLSMGASGGVVTPLGNRGGGLTVIIQANTVMGDNIEQSILRPVEKWARSKGII